MLDDILIFIVAILLVSGAGSFVKIYRAILNHFYPIFSFEAIQRAKEAHEEHKKKVQEILKRLGKRGDIEERRNVFPSEEYLKILKEEFEEEKLSATFLKTYNLMREANYAVLSGESIEKVKEKYEKKKHEFCGYLQGRGKIGKQYDELYEKQRRLYIKHRSREKAFLEQVPEFKKFLEPSGAKIKEETKRGDEKNKKKSSTH